MITCTTAATGAALAGPFARFAEIIRDVPGFASKVWLRDGDMRGGFYLFAVEAAARAYVERAGRGRGPGGPRVRRRTRAQLRG